MSVQEIKDILSCNKVKVKFEKSDGTIREMVATTDSLIIGKEYIPSTKPKNLNMDSDNIRCYDLESKAWRSFNESRLISLEVINDRKET